LFGRIIVLLLLIVVLAGGGLVWFDYIGVIDVKTTLAPIFPFLGREGRTQPDLGDDEYINLNDERFAVLVEAQSLWELDMQKREEEIAQKYGEVEQIAQDLDERQDALEEQQKSINDAKLSADHEERNVEGIAQQLTNMPPERAVAIIAQMNAQQAIDVLRKTDELAQQGGTSSIVPYWMSLLPPERAAEIQRKMVGRP
jgi:flagellar protein FlbB